MTFAFYICTGEPSLVPRLLATHREPGYEVKENHSTIILYEPLIFVALLARGRWVRPRSHISTHLFVSITGSSQLRFMNIVECHQIPELILGGVWTLGTTTNMSNSQSKP